MRGGLTRRMAIASCLLAIVVGAVFAVLISSIVSLRGSERRAWQSEEILVVASRVERLIIDLETGERGFILTGQEIFLEPWRSAQAALPEQTAALQRLVADDPKQQARVQRIAEAATSYVRDHSVPLVDVARRDLAAARTATATAEGKRRVDAMRAEFDQLMAAQRDLAVTRHRASDTAARRAILAGAAGLTGSIVLIVLFSLYLSRAIVEPVRRAATMAGRLASGDLAARLPELGIDEIGALERSFNTMASSLQDGREQLAASRARIVTAADNARRSIERDLHDGIQQQLVSLGLDLRAAEASMSDDPAQLKPQLARVSDALAVAVDELREISRGIHPAILSEGGLGPALKALARRATVPVELDIELQTRLPEPVEVAAYYVASEALTNTAKHARASVAHVEVRVGEGSLHLTIRDDGIGGAVPAQGSTGLTGLRDRVEALGGTLSVISPAGMGTTLRADVPIKSR